MTNRTDDIAQLFRAERRGECFRATELAYALLRRDYPDHVERLNGPLPDEDYAFITYMLTRAVLNCHAVERARLLFDERYRLGERPDRLSRSLGARLLKEEAWLLPAGERRDALLAAARAYASVHEDYRDEAAYTAVNAATLFLLSGEADAADHWAARAVEACDWQTPEEPFEVFYHAATQAEAALVRRDTAAAAEALKRAAQAGLDEYGTHATTFRQLAHVCAHHGIDAQMLGRLAVPDIACYGGHIIAPPGAMGRFPAAEEAAVRARIDQWFDERGEFSFFYGSLAAGSDILFAEACLDRNIDLHVVLPFRAADFVEISVRPSGADWVGRFERCLARCGEASRAGKGGISHATGDAFLGDEALFRHGARYTMGLALLQAERLRTGLRLVTAYDGRGGSGIGVDGIVAAGEALGLHCDILPVETGNGPARAALHRDGQAAREPRRPMAVLFGDVAEFGRLSEADVLRFNDAVLGGMAKEMQGFAANLRHIASWGDSIYAVLDDAAAAARLGLHLQEWMAAARFVPEGTTSPLKLRVAIHFGPVFQGRDGLCGTPTYFGTHVTHAARIEPVTPTGKVYVTEAVAAELKLSDCRDVACDFVGPIPAAKAYGDLLMYVLSRRDDG